MASSFANLFMGHLEQDFLDSQLDKPSLCLRFIDDIFLLWLHGPDSLTAFLEQLNNHYPVHFTWNTSPPTSPFWMSMFTSTRVNSERLSKLNPPTLNNISTITAATPHQPNTPSLTPSPLEGIASVTILMTSTCTPPTSLKLSPPGATQSLSSRNSYSMVSTSPSPFIPPHLEKHAIPFLTV